MTLPNEAWRSPRYSRDQNSDSRRATRGDSAPWRDHWSIHPRDNADMNPSVLGDPLDRPGAMFHGRMDVIPYQQELGSAVLRRWTRALVIFSGVLAFGCIFLILN